ncbi:hypothetical protein Tcan_01472, partial [Toxocara canis]
MRIKSHHFSSSNPRTETTRRTNVNKRTDSTSPITRFVKLPMRMKKQAIYYEMATRHIYFLPSRSRDSHEKYNSTIFRHSPNQSNFICYFRCLIDCLSPSPSKNDVALCILYSSSPTKVSIVAFSESACYSRKSHDIRDRRSAACISSSLRDSGAPELLKE